MSAPADRMNCAPVTIGRPARRRPVGRGGRVPGATSHGRPGVGLVRGGVFVAGPSGTGDRRGRRRPFVADSAAHRRLRHPAGPAA